MKVRLIIDVGQAGRDFNNRIYRIELIPGGLPSSSPLCVALVGSTSWSAPGTWAGGEDIIRI